MVQVIGVDHLSICVSNYDRSKDFYARLFAFLGFEIMDGFSDMVGWRNGKTAFWITPAEETSRTHRPRAGGIGLHHYGFELRDRADVDALHAFLTANGVDVTDPPGEYYEDYYAVYFLDPDGIRLEGLTYGPAHQHGARRHAS